MGLSEMEKRLIFQTEGYGKSEVTYELRTCLPYIPDPVKRKTAADLVRKLDAMPEKDCLTLIQDIRKNYRLPAGPKTIGELPTGARQKSGAEKLKGHDIMAQENQEHPFVLVRGIFYLVCKFLVVVSGAVLGVYQGGCNTRFV